MMANDPSPQFLGFAPLDDQQLSELIAVEQDLGAVIIALKPNVPPLLPLANLTLEQLSRLRQFEQQHGVIALACHWKRGMT
jgi:hypothetical protein